MNIVLPDQSILHNLLSSQPAIRLVALFGSAARHQLRAESDIDIGVWTDHAAVEAERLVWTLPGILGNLLPSCKLDVVLLNTAPALLRFRVARDGQALYERVNGEMKRFVRETLRDYQDEEYQRKTLLTKRVKRLQQGGTYGGSGDILAAARSLGGLLT